MSDFFNSKVVLVTGGNAGIGRAVALAFAQEGAKVVVAARRIEQGEETVAMIKAAGGEGHFVQADVAKAADVKAMVESCVSSYGGLDIAVNNAGIGGPVFVPATEFKEADWDQVLDINLKGVWLSMKYEIPEMLKRGQGAIVNTSSVAGLKGSEMSVAYVASKHGVIGLTKAAALEYAKKGVRVNAVCPAVVETDLTAAVLADEELAAPIKAMHPMGRFGQPEEVAATVLWLCSERASFVTGHAHTVDGGLMAG